ncbi:uncharacterized PE-PGRS family protein PE_PGRS54-like [Lethenteron reissneri]|uniref:uncharacterized PE-PGRS family protein PE_PGRS54-like n=1 Tax=Lethenteron reissneri TaxID=7753 RepID=UPI002AB75DD9|nr:uncharacterized PE-PGRS family protein PE_PGRS54-like [Lethenteron reissneri]
MPWRALLLWPAVLLLSLLLRLLRGPLPPGLESPRRLRLLEAANLLLASLAWLGSRLGLGSQVLLMRRLREAALRPSHATPDDPAVAVRNTRIDGVPVRIYTPLRAGGETAAETHRPRPTIIFFHGGGWMFGSVDSYDHVTRFLVKRTGAELISVEYRLAPEHPFPVPLGDCVRVARCVLGGGTVGPVALCGDSAGGNLATAVALTLARDARTGGRPLPSAQPVALALLYPSLQMIDLNLASHAQSDAVPVLSRARTAACCLAYIGAPQELVPALLKGQHSSPRHRAGLRALVQEEEAALAQGGGEGAAHGFTASTHEDPSVRRRRMRRKLRTSQPGGVTPCGVPGVTHGAVGDAGGKATEYSGDGGGVDGGGIERGFDGFASGVGEGGYGVYDACDDDDGDDEDGGGVDDVGETAVANDRNAGLAAADGGAERRRRRPPPPGLSWMARACLDPLLCPLAVGDGWLRRLPRRLFVLSCEHDVLRDEARALAARARRCGLRVTRHHAAHGFHGVLNFYGRDGRGTAAGWPGGDGDGGAGDGGGGGGVDGGLVRDGGDGGGLGGADGRVGDGGVGTVDVHSDDDDASGGGGGHTRTRHIAATNDNNPAAADGDDDDADDDESSDRAADDDDDSDDDDGGGGGDGAERPTASGPCWLCAWFWPSPMCWLCSRPIIAFRCGEEALEATAAFLRRSLAAAVRDKKTK